MSGYGAYWNPCAGMNAPAAAGMHANPAYAAHHAKPVQAANVPYAAAAHKCGYGPYTSTAIILVLFILLVIIGRAYHKC